jgi:proline dehydrogenase
VTNRPSRTPLEPIRRRLASAYRAGATLDDALEVCRRLAAHGLRSTIGYAARPGEPARAVADAYLAAFDRLSGEQLDCYVSVKLSGLGFDAGLFGELEAAAERSARRLHLDALAPETADATWRVLDGARRAGRLGTTLPGRWRRSAGDTSRAVGLGVAVRVVKGQWADGGDRSVDAAQGFLQVVDRLRVHTGGVGVATHDVRLLTESLRRLTAAETPCEAELFYGLPFRAPALAARRLDVPIRVYVPYGDAGAPYRAADLRGNPAATWWLAQDLLLGKNKTWRSIRRSRPQT